jgi:hypothetical protein
VSQSATNQALEDVTHQALECLARHFGDQTRVLKALLRHFDRELPSAAIAELSERLVAEMLGATRAPRGTRGYDLSHPALGKIEVKARITDEWGKAAQFNLRTGSAEATRAYLLAWETQGGIPALQQAIMAPMDLLKKHFARGAPDYCVRTNWGRVKKLLPATDGKPAA